MLVQAILDGKPSQNIHTVKVSENLEEAARLLSEFRIGALIVSSDGKEIDGVISERDIVREVGKRGTTCLKDTVGDVMTKDVQTCGVDDTAQSVLEAMTKGRFRHLPVVTDGALSGIVTIGDVVNARINEMAAENAAMTDMIRGA